MTLTRLTKPKRHTKFLVMDIESKDGPSRTRAGFTRPFLVGVYDGDTYVQFRDLDPSEGDWKTRYFWRDGCVAQAMRYMLQDKYKGWHIYAHNAGRFDYLFLLPWLMHEGDSLGYQFSVIPVSSSIQALDIRRSSDNGSNVKKWRFLDSFKLIPTSLEKAAKSFGVAGKLTHDLGLHEEHPGWTHYLKQDCVALYTILTRFHNYIENVLGGEMGMTAPSTSVKLFRRVYLKTDLPRSIETHEFVREGYFGGRVEVHHSHGDHLRYYDINSSYPRAMLETMPAGDASTWEGEPPPFVRENLLGFARVNVIVPHNIPIPPLPIRCDSEDENISHANGKLIFPVGKLQGVWEWSELQQAVSMGCIIDKWYESVWYEPVNLFGEFVTDIYKYRDKSSPTFDAGLSEVAKIMLNSAYGKFGMKTTRKQIYRWDDPNLPIDATPASPHEDCPIWYADREVDAPYIMPQISARVTALARVRLLKGMLEALRRGGKIYYVDTDSIITDVELPTSTELGDLKDEYPAWSGRITGRFLAPKLYILSCGAEWQNVRAKGFEQRTVEILERVSRGDTIIQSRLEKVGTLAKRGFQTGPRMRDVPRTLKLDRGKRELLPDGSTRAWVVNMF